MGLRGVILKLAVLGIKAEGIEKYKDKIPLDLVGDGVAKIDTRV